MIFRMARYGNHSHYQARTAPEAEIIRFLEHMTGDSFERIVEFCRDPSSKVPCFHNLVLGSGFGMAGEGEGGELSVIDMTTGHTLATTKGPPIITHYIASFKSAQERLEEAVAKSSLKAFLSCASEGIDSVEGYLTLRVADHNRRHSSSSLIDSKTTSVSFEVKIKDWIPVMTGGSKLERGDRVWADHKKLREFRDDWQVHPKEPFRVTPEDEKLAKELNRFRYGIARLLLNMHMLFAQPIPSFIVECAYLPDIICVPN
ncbi:MAG: hypothetical protein U0822_21445 [Anaerolineae bacterium]